jgi:hypothetical protein
MPKLARTPQKDLNTGGFMCMFCGIIKINLRISLFGIAKDVSATK